LLTDGGPSGRILGTSGVCEREKGWKIRPSPLGPGPGKEYPLYRQVEERIEDLLLQGRYRAGDRIPPEAELVGSLGVSRVTVRAGLARLVDRGLLERRQGSGTFLVRPPPEPGCRPVWSGWRRTQSTPRGWDSS
jgi:DNA-binding transcriptional MocR family regulator